mmetsp:Transcript_24468/g.63785  ORF Transcript_24468/g.63785 Transcript_24468/m.63785 type:complete len:341 (+) Transcript_24468:2641-3663(+)
MRTVKSSRTAASFCSNWARFLSLDAAADAFFSALAAEARSCFTSLRRERFSSRRSSVSIAYCSLAITSSRFLASSCSLSSIILRLTRWRTLPSLFAGAPPLAPPGAAPAGLGRGSIPPSSLSSESHESSSEPSAPGEGALGGGGGAATWGLPPASSSVSSLSDDDISESSAAMEAMGGSGPTWAGDAGFAAGSAARGASASASYALKLKGLCSEGGAVSAKMSKSSSRDGPAAFFFLPLPPLPLFALPSLGLSAGAAAKPAAALSSKLLKLNGLSFWLIAEPPPPPPPNPSGEWPFWATLRMCRYSFSVIRPAASLPDAAVTASTSIHHRDTIDRSAASY